VLSGEKNEIFGDIVGYCGMYTTPGEGEIVNVAVHPAFRRRGIARRLLKRLLEEGRDAQVERFILEVRRSNENAVALYEGLGFQTLGIRPGFYEHPREDALIMCREDSTS
jgi:ribosomal-protein-alanine N-acetyltransferase